MPQRAAVALASPSSAMRARGDWGRSPRARAMTATSCFVRAAGSETSVVPTGPGRPPGRTVWA